jgi:hypothetical protein
MTDEKWRSPNNDYGPEVGLDNGDVETFKKEPEEALARETGQNSNDARYNSSYTKMEYKLFEVEHDAIPGIDELSEMIEACYEYKKELPKEAVQLKRMLERSHDKKIKCLRISDFHTSGLEGVLSNDAEKPFYLLTKGSGISYKGSGAGGSKGIGKYAAFVNSNINTVFYSTYNKDNPKKEKANEDDDAFKHQNGSLTDDGDDGKKQNTGGGGEDNPYDDPNDQGGRGTAIGNEPILKKVKLGGIKYKNIVVDEKAGRYDFRFTAPHDEADFELELKMCGDGSDTYTLDIISAEVDYK